MKSTCFACTYETENPQGVFFKSAAMFFPVLLSYVFVWPKASAVQGVNEACHQETLQIT